MVVRIIKPDRQLLNFCKQLISYFKNSMLGYPNHHAGLQILGNDSHRINTRHNHQGMQQLIRTPVFGSQAVYDGTQHIGTGQHGNGINYDTCKNQRKLVFFLLDIGKQPFYGFSRILRLASGHPPTASSRPGASRPGSAGTFSLCAGLLRRIGIFSDQRFFSGLVHDALTSLSIWE